MGITLYANTRNLIVDAVTASLDGGTVEILTAGNLLLATLTLANPAFSAAVDGTATANAIAEDTGADASGTAAKFVVKDSGAVARFEGDVTATGGGGAMELVTTAIVAGQPVQISSFTLTQPAS